MREPAPRDRAYVGFREAGAIAGQVVQRVELNGRRSPLDPRHDLRNHSPDGFEWGYLGSGPAQLALALAADATGDDALALRIYHDLKFEIVVGLGDSWQREAGNIADFCRHLDRSAA